ncbi:hypothetical protein TNCV_2778741 [Trichonephila clavipes]|nr:hypothetical protein TNCV_2778741 [Trichonephila clavipes]
MVALRKQLQRITDISSCRGNDSDTSQQASLLSNCTPQQSDKFRGVLWLEEGLYASCLQCYIPLKVGHQWQHLEWSKEHKNWTTYQWSSVLFTDENHFSAASVSSTS